MADTVEPDYRCGLCKKSFKQKSSLVRHAKRCTLEPRPSGRQKACRTCIVAKARCDLQRPTCSRCSSRNQPCVYMRPARVTTSHDDISTANSDSVTSANHGLAPVCGIVQPDLSISTEAIRLDGPNTGTYQDCGTDFAGLQGPTVSIHCGGHLFPSESVDTSDATSSSESGFHSTYSGCGTTGTHARYESLEAQIGLDNSSPSDGVNVPITPENFGYLQLAPFDLQSFCPKPPIITTATDDSEEIEPWVLALAAKNITPDPQGLVEHSAQSIFRFFRTWPRMLAKGIQLPPIIHPLQFCLHDSEVDGGVKMPKLIGRCVTLCKMWVGQAEDSSPVVESAVRGEIESILSKYHTYDAPTLLSAMQSIMILLVLLIFPSNRQTTLSIVPAHIFAAVQDLGNLALSTGMLLHEEATHVRPSWRVWAHIEAKRRTLMSIYFLHWANSTYHGTRHFNCLQLGRVLAPGAKWLWQSTDEAMWTKLYSRWLAQWDGKEMIQAEFFLVENGPVIEPRVERWLEDADELGILMMTMLNASQRDLSKIPGAAANIIG
ncbi:hypothetical protein F5Y08DRAFT_322319 [Xylaria arbuscula]|nr:hypothetical protein F5Y08DRAFT_322319 [Xylaria arbuscula]